MVRQRLPENGHLGSETSRELHAATVEYIEYCNIHHGYGLLETNLKQCLITRSVILEPVCPNQRVYFSHNPDESLDEAGL